MRIENRNRSRTELKLELRIFIVLEKKRNQKQHKVEKHKLGEIVRRQEREVSYLFFSLDP